MTRYNFTYDSTHIHAELYPMQSRPGYYRVRATDGQTICSLTLPVMDLNSKQTLNAKILAQLQAYRMAQSTNKTTRMREIKFRAWHSATKQMFYKSNTDIFILAENLSALDVLQFTGLLDSTGKEIYEGDVVTWGSTNRHSEMYETEVRVAEVKINPDLQFDCRNIRFPQVFHYARFHYKDTKKYLTVLGNIFEHPELIK